MSEITRAANQPSIPHRGFIRRKPRLNWGVVLILPYLVMMFFFHLGPIIMAITFSFSKFVGGRPQLFVAGLANYIKVFSDPAFSRSYTNVVQFSVLATLLGFIGSLGIALLLSLTRDRLGSITRSIFFLPGSVNAAVVGLIFIFMLDPLVSPFGVILRSFGWDSTTDYISASNAVVVMTVLRFFMSSGAWIAIFYSALESVPQELIEAARMDGCGPWQLAWMIRRPIIMGFVWFMIIQLVSYNLQIFAEPYIISRALGGGSFIDPFWSPNMLGAHYTLTLGDMGMSAVVSLSQTLISLSASIFIVTKTGAFTTDVTD